MEMSNGKNETKRLIKVRIMTAFEWKAFFVWRVTFICVHVTQSQILPTSLKHVSLGMHFLGLGIGVLSHQCCMSLHIGTNNIVGGSSTLLVVSTVLCAFRLSDCWMVPFGMRHHGSHLSLLPQVPVF